MKAYYQEFEYADSQTPTKVYVLEETESSLKGIKLTDLSKEELLQLQIAHDAYQNVIDNLAKNHFRHYKKGKMRLSND